MQYLLCDSNILILLYPFSAMLSIETCKFLKFKIIRLKVIRFKTLMLCLKLRLRNFLKEVP